MQRTLIALMGGMILAACGTTPDSGAKREAQDKEVEATIIKFKGQDPSLGKWFKEAHGYAIFPSIGKGGIGVGGLFGRGQVFKEGEMIGWAKVTEVNIGLQLGGQSFSEVIFFKNEKALRDMTSGSYEFSADASAVAATKGAGTAANYSKGVAVFTYQEGGLMAGATIGGQKFKFVHK